MNRVAYSKDSKTLYVTLGNRKDLNCTKELRYRLFVSINVNSLTINFKPFKKIKLYLNIELA